MGRSRKRKSEEVDGCLVALVVPAALVCAFPILLVPIIIGIVLWIATDIIKMVEKFKTAKEAKEFEENFSRKNLLKEREKIVRSIKKVCNNVVVYNNDDKTNNTFSFSEILSICDDIENKLLEVEEDNDELDSLYFELHEYDNTIEIFINIKLGDLNNDLLDIVRNSYDHFLELYDDFNLLISDDSFEHVKEGDRISISDAATLGAVGYSIYKNCKKAREEKGREEYREELRNTW